MAKKKASANHNRMSNVIDFGAMNEQQIYEHLKANRDHFSQPHPVGELRGVCRDAAQTQWDAEKQFERLHLFDCPRCVFTEQQFENEWNNHALLGWSNDMPENTVAEAIVCNQLDRLRASLAGMLRFLKLREVRFSKQRTSDECVWVFQFLGEPRSWKSIRRDSESGDRRKGLGGTTRKVSIAISNLPHGNEDNLAKPKPAAMKARAK